MKDSSLTFKQILQTILYCSKQQDDKDAGCRLILKEGSNEEVYYNIVKVDKDIVLLRKTDRDFYFVKIEDIKSIICNKSYNGQALEKIISMMPDLSVFT